MSWRFNFSVENMLESWSSFLRQESFLIRPKFHSNLNFYNFPFDCVLLTTNKSQGQLCGDRCSICCVHTWAVLCCNFTSNFCSQHENNIGWSTSESSNKNTIHPEDFLTNFEGHHFHTTLTTNDVHVCTLRIVNTFICKMCMKRL